MFYCEKCKSVWEAEPCQACGNRRLRLPASGDYCFLMEKEYMWASMLDEVLKDNGIPSVSMEVLDDPYGLRRFERARVYVPFGAYDLAKELMAELFEETDSLE